MKNSFEVINKQSHSNPLMLVLVLLAAVGLSTILQHVVLYAVFRLVAIWNSATTIYLSLFMQLIAFPFWMTCIVWLAARSGRTAWSTWTVPLVLIVAPSLTALLVSLLQMAAAFPNVSSLRIVDIIYFQWVTIFRSGLLTYVLLALVFRATTLHLRPVEVAALPFRLTILSMLLLTTTVAIGLSIEVVANHQVWTQMKPLTVQINSLNQFNILTDLLQKLSNGLVWFSVAWLFVAKDRKDRKKAG